MKTKTLLAGLGGFLLGRSFPAQAAEPVREVMTVERVVYYPANEGALDHELTETAGRALAYRRFEPRNSEQWAYRQMDQVPLFPRLGRRWDGGAEYLYFLPRDVVVCFPAGIDPLEERTGPGWVIVRDEPQLGLRVSPVVAAQEVLELLTVTSPDEAWPVPARELFPPGWWDEDNDPIYTLQAPWVPALGFLSLG